MERRFKKKSQIIDITITAVAAVLSVGIMLYGIRHFGLVEAWPELVLNLCYIACLIMRIPYPILMGTVIGVTNMIPVFGPYIGAIPCAIIIFIASPVKCLYFIIYNVIMQQVEGNIICPLILGDSTGISGFWVLFSIVIFGGYFGFGGMIFGVPVFAVIYHIIWELVAYSLEKRGEEERLIDYLSRYRDKEDQDHKDKRLVLQRLTAKQSARQAANAMSGRKENDDTGQ